MKTAIIIPTVPGNEEVLIECLNSIHRELQAVNNKNYIVHIEKNDFEGFAFAVNKAIKIVFKNPEVDGVLIVNDDVTVLENTGKFLSDMTRIAKEKNGVVVDSALYRNNGKAITFAFGYLPKFIINNIGLMDERFKMLEWDDTDYSVRIQEAGYTLNKLDYKCISDLTDGKARKRFNKKQTEEMNKNRERFKEKWKGTKWEKIFIK